MSRERAIQQWLIERIAELSGTDAGRIDPAARFTSFGLDSLILSGMCLDLGTWLGRDVPDDIVWQYRDINALAAYLAGGQETPAPAAATGLPESATRYDNLVQLVQARAGTSRGGYIFLGDGETEAGRLDFAGLATRARAIGASLQGRVERGDRVLLVMPAGLEFVTGYFGCHHAAAIAVPTPSLGRPLSRAKYRLQSIAADAQPRVLLTTGALLPLIEEVARDLPELRGVDVIDVAGIADSEADAWREPAVGPDDLALLQYTSGSTSSPKGVMVSHGNMLVNAAFYHDGWHHSPDTVTVTWMPHFHDFGLMDGVTEPVFGGFLAVFMPPVAFIRKPMRWLQAISKYRATFTSAPNFAFDLCGRHSTPEQAAELDLSSLECVTVAAEPVRKATLDRFTERFATAGFRSTMFCPSFGLAEATLKVSTTPRGAGPSFVHLERAALEQNRARIVNPGIDTADTIAVAGCGPAVSCEFDTEVIIVDPTTGASLSDGEVGELWIRGPTIAKGYWQRPQATVETFLSRPTEGGSATFLRTGDLGFIRGGVLYITGRLKDMIIIHGRNIYPHDIECAAEASVPEALQPGCSAAFPITTPDGEESVVLVAEARAGAVIDEAKIVAAIRDTLMELCEVAPHAIELIQRATIPKTSSGKIQRRACRDMYLAGTLALYRAGT